MNDKTLIRQIRQGKTEYAGEIAERYYDDIYRFLRFQTGDGDLAGDLTQETFLRFIRYVESYTDKNLKGYLLTVAGNVCRDHWREKSRRDREQPFGDIVPETGAMAGEGPETKMAIQQALLFLPDFQREAIVLHYFYDLKYREIGKMTGASVPTVKSRIRQGCRKLGELLSEEDFYEG